MGESESGLHQQGFSRGNNSRSNTASPDIGGFCQFAKISRQNFYEYESREEFSDILTCVREAIEADQLEGALCGQYDSGIVARVLHLADRQDVTTNGKEITTATQSVSVVLDPEAAKIIQSIGKMTVAVKE